MKVYQRHSQANAIDFVNCVVKKFPFRIRTIRTDRGHEFQTLFHWHVADLGMEHVYIKPRTPQLNGKVERSHRTDKDEFYQLLTHRDDVDLRKKLAAWEKFYNYDRPHGAHKGKTPYEVLREKLSGQRTSYWMRNITAGLTDPIPCDSGPLCAVGRQPKWHSVIVSLHLRRFLPFRDFPSAACSTAARVSTPPEGDATACDRSFADQGTAKKTPANSRAAPIGTRTIPKPGSPE